jgi:hypothetical protein
MLGRHPLERRVTEAGPVWPEPQVGPACRVGPGGEGTGPCQVPPGRQDLPPAPDSAQDRTPGPAVGRFANTSYSPRHTTPATTTPPRRSKKLRCALRRDDRLCERYRELLRDNYHALLLRRLRIVWYRHRASRKRNLYRGCRRYQLAILQCLDALIPVGDPG